MVLHKNGRVRLRLISASPNDALRAISQRGIVLRNIKQIDQLTVTFVAQRHDMEMINQTAQRRGERLELLGQQGTYWGIRRLLRRPVLMCGILFVFFLALFLPTRVFFIQAPPGLIYTAFLRGSFWSRLPIVASDLEQVPGRSAAKK